MARLIYNNIFKLELCLGWCKFCCVVRKSAFCICENKDADQVCGNREADQHLCFRYTESTILLLPKSEISSLQPSSVVVQSDLCGTRSETLKTSFLTTRLKFCFASFVVEVQLCMCRVLSASSMSTRSRHFGMEVSHLVN